MLNPRSLVPALAGLALLAAGALAPASPAIAVSSARAAEAPAATPAADPCDGVAALPDGASCGGQLLCSPRQRVRLACDLREALERRYVFWNVKGSLLPAAGGARFDARRHADACVAAERAVADESDPLRFYDRMRACTAAFDDGHLMLGTSVRLPDVALGVGVRLAEGRLYVAHRDRKVMAWLRAGGAPDLDRALAVGNEVLAVDGQPALEAVAELSRYLPASSDAARLERAADALTRRNFAYPARRTVRLTVLSNGAARTVELPWWLAPGGDTHPMVRAWARRTGVAVSDRLDWRYDAGRDAWYREAGPIEGALRGDTILPRRDAAGLREYKDEQDRPAVRLGEVVRRRDRAFCYAQILTFQTETLGSPDGREPFTDVLEDFVKGCKEKGLDLVLDLRQNEGGYLSHTSRLMAALGEPEKTYPGGALVVRATAMNQLIYEQRAPAGAAAAHDDDPMDPRHIADAIGAAERARAFFSPAFLERPLRASEAVGGYAGRVVALVAPTCMSACDRLAALLQRSGRATLVGGPTEGAGGSQQETRALPVRWSDADGLLTLSMPNAAMGVQRGVQQGLQQGAEPALKDGVQQAAVHEGAEAAVPAGERTSDEFFQALTFENRPVVPEVSYGTTRDDLLHQNRGWLEAAETALFAPGPARGGVVARAPGADGVPGGTAHTVR